jgi:hypothetical protein
MWVELLTNIVALIIAVVALIGIKMMDLSAILTALLVAVVVLLVLMVMAGVFTKKLSAKAEQKAS